MKLLKNDIFKNFLILFIPIMLIEIALKIIVGFNILDWSLVRIIFGVSFISIFFGYIFALFKIKVSRILNITVLFLLEVYALAQITFNDSMGAFMSANSSSQLTKVTDYIFDYIATASWQFYMVLIPFVLLILYYVFLDKKIVVKEMHFAKKSLAYVLISLGLVASCFFLAISLPFMQNKYQVTSNRKLFRYPGNPNVAVKEFGITTYAFIDFKTLLTGAEEETIEKEVNKKPEQQVTNYTRIIDDTIWNSVNESETNKSYVTLNNYFMNRTITSRNEMTGYFKDKNLIVIQMESVSNIPLLYPELFPTLNKLYNEGWAWVNNYSPRNSCATGNNEMTAMTSLFTINNSCTANTYKNNEYPYSIFGLFNRAGYNTTSYHNYADHYYSRKTIHKNMGSSKYYNAYDLGIKVTGAYEEWPSDIELFSKSYEKYMKQDKFMAYFTTVTAHRPYTVSSTYGDKYLDLFKDLKLSMQSKRYLSKVKEMDLALQELLDELTATGKLDDTVIVIYDDHYPYGLSNSAVQEFFDYDITENYERDRTPFIIYNPSLTPQKFEEYTTFMNVLPTLANLFDMDYDPRLYIGQDLFDPNYQSIAIFTDGSWQTEIGFYDASNSDMDYLDETKTYTDEEIININTSVANKIKMSNMAIRKNYFKYLYNSLNNIEGKINTTVVKPVTKVEETILES